MVRQVISVSLVVGHYPCDVCHSVVAAGGEQRVFTVVEFGGPWGIVAGKFICCRACRPILRTVLAVSGDGE